MPSILFGPGLKEFLAGGNWLTDTIKCALVTSGYSPDQDAHDFFNDVTNEVVGTGYVAGGATLGSKTLTYDAASNELRFDAADPSWAASTITARGAVVYKSTGVAGTSPLIAYIDFGSDIVSSGGTFSVSFPAYGVFKLAI